MKRVKKNSGLWHYLNTIGILEKGSDEDIKKAKKEYRKQYIREYKRVRRKIKQEYCLVLDKEERQIISEAAKRHGLNSNRYIKKAALAYTTNIYIVPHASVLHHINQLSLRCLTSIGQIASKEKSSWYQSERNYEELEKIIQAIQRGVNEAFANPPLLQTVILSTLQTNPSFIEVLKKIIINHDIKVNVEKNGLV